MKRPIPVPTSIEQIDARTLGIGWSDGHASAYEVRGLRLACAASTSCG